MPNAIQMVKQDHKKVATLFDKYKHTKKEEAKRRIAEQKQLRAIDRQVRCGAQFRLIDLIEEADALCGDVRLQPGDRLIEAIGALLADHAFRRCRSNRSSKREKESRCTS